MTDAPEKIWAGKYGGTWWQSRPHHQMTEYTRTDLHLALVAAAYVDAANLHQSLWRETSAYKTDQMLKRTPADAQASLEKVKREARNEARREAAQLVFNMTENDNLRGAILALMEDTDDE